MKRVYLIVCGLLSCGLVAFSPIAAQDHQVQYVKMHLDADNLTLLVQNAIAELPDETNETNVTNAILYVFAANQIDSKTRQESLEILKKQALMSNDTAVISAVNKMQDQLSFAGANVSRKVQIANTEKGRPFEVPPPAASNRPVSDY